MTYAVAIDKTELCKVALEKIFAAISREINPSLLIYYLRGSENAEEKLEELKAKAMKENIALDAKIIDYQGGEKDAENIFNFICGVFSPLVIAEQGNILNELRDLYIKNMSKKCYHSIHGLAYANGSMLQREKTLQKRRSGLLQDIYYLG